jgi:NAD(P)H-dependent flavin oxidoreductase YrpB (nitropropane dioxygenase family)
MTHPKIIQGGMGVAVSGWLLARTVSKLGQLGVVSGTALGVILARRLQLGDPGGDMRRALDHFPIPSVAERVASKYYIAGGKAADKPFKLMAMPTIEASPAFNDLTVVANFAEVYLAKEGHQGLVGVNFMEKLQLPTLPSLFGTMLAGVDYILMGAGIPRHIPGAIDALVAGKTATLKLDVDGAAPGEETNSVFDPRTYFPDVFPTLKRPFFLGIVASATLAMTLARKSNGRVDGFVVEGETAGGHNAPPRGPLQLNKLGEPIYGPRDVVDLEKIRELGLPFWLAGSFGQPGKLKEALQLGATGVQVGTAFAFCEESSIRPDFKKKAIEMSRAGTARVYTDPLASPTGFPFKVVSMPGTLSEEKLYAARPRICDLGYLRKPYRRPDGSLGYRCAAEPVEDYVAKGGKIEDTKGRKCICNSLSAAVDLGQTRSATDHELAILTAGNDATRIAEFIPPGQNTYTAEDVIKRLLS